MSLKNKLNRLKPHLSVGNHSEKEVKPTEISTIEIPFLDKWKQANVSPYFLDENFCLIREVKYPLSHQHGHYCFHDIRTAVQSWNQNSINHPLSAKGHKVEDLFFLIQKRPDLEAG